MYVASKASGVATNLHVTSNASGVAYFFRSTRQVCPSPPTLPELRLSSPSLLSKSFPKSTCCIWSESFRDIHGTKSVASQASRVVSLLKHPEARLSSVRTGQVYLSPPQSIRSCSSLQPRRSFSSRLAGPLPFPRGQMFSKGRHHFGAGSQRLLGFLGTPAYTVRRV